MIWFVGGVPIVKVDQKAPDYGKADADAALRTMRNVFFGALAATVLVGLAFLVFLLAYYLHGVKNV